MKFGVKEDSDHPVRIKLTRQEAQCLKAVVGDIWGTGPIRELTDHLFDWLDEFGGYSEYEHMVIQHMKVKP